MVGDALESSVRIALKPDLGSLSECSATGASVAALSETRSPAPAPLTPTYTRVPSWLIAGAQFIMTLLIALSPSANATLAAVAYVAEPSGAIRAMPLSSPAPNGVEPVTRKPKYTSPLASDVIGV